MSIIKYILPLIFLIFINSCSDGVKFKGGKTYDLNSEIIKDSLKINSEIDSILNNSDSTFKFKIGPIIKDTIIFN